MIFFKLPVNRYLDINIEGKIGQPTVIRTSSFINSLYHFERIPGNIHGAYVTLESELIQYHVNPETDKIKIKTSGDRSKVSRISNFVVLSFSVITDDLTLSSKDQNIFCIVNCKEDYDHLKLACKPIFQKINTLYEKASIEVEGKHFDLDILMGGGMRFLQLLLGLGGSLCNYSCPLKPQEGR
jgi:hypothetical protein